MVFNFLFGVIAMSNMVWKIEITGAKPETEYILMKELDKMGIKKETTISNAECRRCTTLFDR